MSAFTLKKKCTTCPASIEHVGKYCIDCAKVRKKEQNIKRYLARKVTVEKKCTTCDNMIKSNKLYCEPCRKERQKAADTRFYNKRRESQNLAPKKEKKIHIDEFYTKRGLVSSNSNYSRMEA